MENVNAITTRSGKVLNPAALQGKSSELAIDLEETDDPEPENVRESANEDMPKESLPAQISDEVAEEILVDDLLEIALT
ncbi:unnamed protein product [Arabis nemorensis]|uniref:Uncharacterized protein n=1 Tax=Arabis nemorensis TaxID=586526 RepID=A0A565BBQ0_9BRAS|nr:unnamed protein product [Arabis nemorensis]